MPSGEAASRTLPFTLTTSTRLAADPQRRQALSASTAPEKVLPNTFGGLQNWFFTGPSGEQIEAADAVKRTPSPSVSMGGVFMQPALRKLFNSLLKMKPPH